MSGLMQLVAFGAQDVYLTSRAFIISKDKVNDDDIYKKFINDEVSVFEIIKKMNLKCTIKNRLSK